MEADLLVVHRIGIALDGVSLVEPADGYEVATLRPFASFGMKKRMDEPGWALWVRLRSRYR